MIDEFSHEREDVSIVCGGSEYYPAVSEGILNHFSHIGACEVVYNHLGTSLGFKSVSKELYSLLSVAVYGSICDHDAVCLYAVA